jgi:hypothetical protein
VRGERSRGSSTAEYIGVVGAVALLMLALLAVREHHPERRPPVDPVAHVAELLRAPWVSRPRPPAPARPRPPRPRRPRPPAPPRPTVLVPSWAIGW